MACRGPLTRQDAELLRSRPPYTWGAKYETLVIAAVLFWAAVLIFGLVRHTQMVRLVIPLISWWPVCPPGGSGGVRGAGFGRH